MLYFLRPRAIFHAVTDISAQWLLSRGITLLLLDFDNTLLPYTSLQPIDGFAEWVAALEEAGITLAVVSNSHSRRVPEFCEKAGIGCIPKAGKPSRRGIKAALEKYSVPPEKAALAGDQLITDVLGANRCKVMSLLVTPVDLSNIFLRLRHALETPIIRSAKAALDRERGSK